MTPPVQDLLHVGPEIVLAVFGSLIVLAEPFLPRRSKDLLGHIALIGVLAALGAMLVVSNFSGADEEVFGGLMVNDGYGLFARVLILLVTGLTVIASLSYFDREGAHRGEYYALLLFSAIGLNLMVAATDLVFFFLALETASIGTYVLVGFRRNDTRSNEASLKYFLLGSFATAILLYGVALLYGATGSTRLTGIAGQLSSANTPAAMVYLGMGLLFTGLAFKVAAAPFQIWTPDVYEGAPTPVTAFLSTAPKAAAIVAFIRIFQTALGPLSAVWTSALWGSAILTILIGNFGALMQTSVKRMLAYSSIAHAGYILIGLAVGRGEAVAAVLFYLAAYALMKLGAFAVVSHVSAGKNENESSHDISDYAGLHARRPGLAAAMTVFMLSLIGLPLTAGFVGKLYLFKAGLSAGMVGLIILAAINSVLSAGYYLRIVKAMYMDEPKGDATVAPLSASLSFVLTLTALGTVFLGVYPTPLLEAARLAASTLGQ